MIAEVESGESLKQQDPLEHKVSVGSYIQLRKELCEMADQFIQVQLGTVDILDDHVLQYLVKTQGGVSDFLVDVSQALESGAAYIKQDLEE